MAISAAAGPGGRGCARLAGVKAFDRRYALLGFVAWNLIKRQARRRAKRALPGSEAGGGSRGRGLAGLVVLAAAALGGLLWWRSRRGGAEEPEDGPAGGEPAA